MGASTTSLGKGEPLKTPGSEINIRQIKIGTEDGNRKLLVMTFNLF